MEVPDEVVGFAGELSANQARRRDNIEGEALGALVGEDLRAVAGEAEVLLGLGLETEVGAEPADEAGRGTGAGAGETLAKPRGLSAVIRILP